MLWSLLFISLIALCNAEDETELNGTTSQSTDYKGPADVPYVSTRAIDGNQTRCAHTRNEINSWWRIDLLGVYTISSIRIYNVEHHNSNITGSRIYIGNSREENGTTNRICKNITYFKKGHWNNFTCNTNLSGRYITVFHPEQNILVLCEVKIFGTKKESPFHLVRENKTWEDALYHCREQDKDLASIVDEDTQAWAELHAKDADTHFVWLGLRYTCTLGFWFWVDDQRVDFTRWGQNGKEEQCEMSGVMKKHEDHLWFSKPDYETYNFICAEI
ncbi:fucolectin-1-like [Sebastes fasciatus]|uniref:fucolectin-1-like n=1 Tax=Sebastes fasciatus TaxID=394691 RepID=UPI003D9EF2C4